MQLTLVRQSELNQFGLAVRRWDGKQTDVSQFESVSALPSLQKSYITRTLSRDFAAL